MGRAPCCDKTKVKTGPWSQEEDLKLIRFVAKHGHSNWRSLPRQAGLLRCGKSCRLRWINYLRPDVKRGNFTAEEEETIINLQRSLGNKWSKIASQLPGRTDNEIKNVWNTHLKKRLMSARETNSSTSDHMNHQSTDDSSPQRTIQESIDHHQFNNPNSHQKQPDDHLHEQPRSETPLSLSSSSSTPDLSPATSNASESFEIDDVWEMLESLDGLGASQSSTDLHFDGLLQDMEYEYSEVELHKWLRFFEEELGIASEDADNVGKRIM